MRIVTRAAIDRRIERPPPLNHDLTVGFRANNSLAATAVVPPIGEELSVRISANNSLDAAAATGMRFKANNRFRATQGLALRVHSNSSFEASSGFGMRARANNSLKTMWGVGVKFRANNSLRANARFASLEIHSNSSLRALPRFGLRPMSANNSFRATAAVSDYGWDRDIVVAGQTSFPVETFVNFVIQNQLITDPTFKSVANGGRITSATYDDVRFQLPSGTKLNHTVVAYNAGTGALRYDLQLPSGAVAADFLYRVRYGNAGITAPEANPAGCWSKAVAAWEWAGGTDLSGHGRTMSLRDVTAVTLINPPAGRGGVFTSGAATGPLVYPDVPTATGTVRTATGQTDFNNKHADSTSGDHLVCNFGSVAGFTPRAGVTYRAFTNQGTVISSAMTCGVDDVTLLGFDFGDSKLTISTACNNFKARRCRWHGASNPFVFGEEGPITVSNSGTDTHFEYCQVDTFSGTRGIWNNPQGLHMVVDYCLFKDFTGSGPDDRKYQTYEPLTTGESYHQHTVALNCIISNSVFKNLNLGNQENEAPSLKSAGGFVTNCLFDDARQLSLRYGVNARITSCKLIGNSEVQVHGAGHILNAIEVVNTAKGFNFVCGDYDSVAAPTMTDANHPSAYNVQVIGCKGKGFVGATFGDAGMDKRAKLIKFYGHVSGAITNVQEGANEWTEQAADATHVIAAACTITNDPAVVGVLGGL